MGGQLPPDEILRGFLERCTLKSVHRITLVRLSGDGTPGGTQLDEWELAEVLTGLEEDSEAFIDVAVQRCHQETDGVRATSSFKLYAYLENGERHAFCTAPIVVQAHQDALEGGNFEGSSTMVGTLKTLTGHIERREYQSVQLVEMVLRLAMRGQDSANRRIEAYEAKGLKVFELEQQLLDRRHERELDAKREERSQEGQAAVLKQLGPYIPAALQHLASFATKGQLPAPKPVEESSESETESPADGPTIQVRFLGWVSKYPDAADKLAEVVGEDKAAQLLELAQLDGGELRGAIMFWMSENDVTRKTLVDIVGEEGQAEFFAILKGE